MSLKVKILRFIESQRGWVNGGEIEKLSIELGYKASNGSRRSRELAREGKLARKEQNGSVWYQAKFNDPVQIFYSIVDDNPPAKPISMLVTDEFAPIGESPKFKDHDWRKFDLPAEEFN